MPNHTSRAKRTPRIKDPASSIAAIKRHRTARLASLATKSYYLHRRGQDEQMFDHICEEFMELGGIYVKFLQGVLLQSSIMRRWKNPDKLKIFENLDHEQINIVETLQHNLPAGKLAQIALVQPQPFAAGSFGQVYYGQHANGTPIIIKALRPMVTELLKYDLRILGMFSRSLVSKMSNNMDVDLDQALKDFRAATLRETDYRAEANFAHELYEAYKDHPTFIIPETFLDLCTDNIIVQEYIDGLSVAQLIRLKGQGVDPKAYVQQTLGSDLDVQLETLGIESVNGIFNLPRVQGDPHPGNIRLMTNNRVGMIDFGISAPTPTNKAAFFGLIVGWDQLYHDNFDMVSLFEKFVRFFVNDLYRALKRLESFSRKSNPSTGSESDDYTKAVGKIAEETFKKAVGVQDIRPMIEDGRILQVLNQMVNKGNRFGFVMKLDSSEILRAAQTYITLVETLGRRTVVLPRVFSEVVRRVKLEHPELIHEDEAAVSVSQALETVSNWLERVAVRDPGLFSQLMKRVKLNGMPSEVSSSAPEKEKVHA